MLLIFGITLFICVSDVSAATFNGSTTNSSSSIDSENQTGTTPTSPTVTFTTGQISTAASNVKTFSETNNRLPEYVTISNTNVTMAQFLQLLTDGVLQINSGTTTPLTLKIMNIPSSQSETVTTGTIYKSEYLNLAQQIKNTMDTTGTAPATINTSMGTMKFENLVYTYTKIMNFYTTNNRLPNSVSVKATTYPSITNTSSTTPSEGSSNTSTSSGSGNQTTATSTTVTFTTSQIISAASNVKTFKETNNRLPEYVTISNTQVTMAQFLQLLTDGVLQINDGTRTPLTLKIVNGPLSQSESVISGTIYKSEYLNLAQQIKNTIDNGTAPATISTSLGKMQFENLIYTYSKIMNFYGTNNRLPSTVSVKAFSNITSTTNTSVPLKSYSPYNVAVTSQYISATAKCSCGSGTYTYKTSTFLNYCPQCKRYGTLIRSTKNPEYEGQWTCTYCDCDYCMQCGKEKMSGTKLWLKPYII